MTYRVTDADCEDFETLFAVQTASIEKLTTEYYSEAEIASWLRQTTVNNVAQALDSDDEAFFAARETADGSVLGYTSVCEDRVVSLYVHPDHIQGGVGSALLGAAEQHAVEAGEDRMCVSATMNGVDFYAAHGYRSGALSTLTLKDGMELRTVEMCKPLSPLRLVYGGGPDGSGGPPRQRGRARLTLVAGTELETD